eukprot:TRINITY_DN1004_c0_g1_i1.p2 TRINITY_DN1004_c0_g1~~TRINITY_DN1004_c0_g1_i1.p2  ORF type:complete len:453 (+),score=158.18 TRINITY_DN1004_c0_g1_i1:94-1359(+)
MPRITLDLLRRRAEHNEGVLSTLEEITLHQQDLEAIEIVGDVCRNLQILYLQNNLIRRIENLNHLKCLWYLNLAINSIETIEGLEGCENLKKLDLTLNFIGDLTCVKRLRKNAHLQVIYLTGNPCTDVEGYRAYVLQQLPQLQSLDGDDIKRSEIIRANQDADPVAQAWRQESEKVAEEKRRELDNKAKGVVEPDKFNEKGEKLYGNTPDDRDACYRDMQKKIDESKNPPKDPNSISAIWEENERASKPRKLSPAEEIEKYGRVLQKNEAKFPYKMWEDENNVYLEVQPGKFIATSSIQVDIQPEYARVEVKGKVIQLLLSSEVAPSRASVKRGTAKGELLLTMPIVGAFKGVADLRIKKPAAGAAAADQTPADAVPPKEMDKLARDSLLKFEKVPEPDLVETKGGGVREARKSAAIEELD